MVDATDEILDMLRQIARAGDEVKLINIYKGYPVSYPAHILGIGIDAVTFKVHPYQALCLWMENQTFLQSDQLPEVVRALAVTVDLENEIAALSNFEYINGAAGNRQDTRVQLRKSIEVDLLLADHRYRTELRDLSNRGMAVFLDAAYYNPDIFRISAPLELKFSMPHLANSKNEQIDLQGVIRSITRDQVNRYRIGIQIRPEEQSEVLVSDYVDQRHAEVMDEIKMLHASILGLSSSKDQPELKEY